MINHTSSLSPLWFSTRPEMYSSAQRVILIRVCTLSRTVASFRWVEARARRHPRAPGHWHKGRSLRGVVEQPAPPWGFVTSGIPQQRRGRNAGRAGDGVEPESDLVD